jgi:hypothetical protein
MEACAQPTPTTCTVFALAGIGILTTTSWSGNSSRRQRSEWVAAEMEMKGLGKRISGCIPFVPLARGHGWARGRAQEDAWTVWPDASAAQDLGNGWVDQHESVRLSARTVSNDP